MKKIYSLQVFLAEVKKIADSVGQTYFSARVEANSDHSVSFDCYINDYNRHESETMEGALQKMRNEINKRIEVLDVEIETEEKQVVDEMPIQ